MDQATFEKEFEKRQPWRQNFTLFGRVYGGPHDCQNDPRILTFLRAAPKVRKILDLGILEGGQTLVLARHYPEIVAFEANQEHNEKCKFIFEATGARNIELRNDNLETFDLASIPDVDAIFCSGILYHMSRPWELIERMAKTAPLVHIWTHVVDKDDPRMTSVDGHEGRILEQPYGTAGREVWLSMRELYSCLIESGLSSITNHASWCHDAPSGPSVLLTARRSSSCPDCGSIKFLT